MLKRSLLLSLLLLSPAMATKTQFFTHATKADFESGKLDGLVATNFGELKLAHDVQEIIADAGQYASVDAMVEAPDGAIYVGTSASGKLLVIRDGKSNELADFGEASAVSSLAVNAGGDVLVGVSGESAELHILRKGAKSPQKLLAIDNAQYIWGIALASDGKIYLATGPQGLLVEVSADGKTSRVLYDSDEDNLRAVAILNDSIFVGTDPNGLILKVDRATGKAFVIYDAPESEISALLVDTRGGQIYAATSQLVESPDATTKPDDSTTTGHPQENNAADHITAEPSDPPKPKQDNEPNHATPFLAVRHEPTMPGEAESPPTSQPNAPANASANGGHSPAGPHPTMSAAPGTTGEVTTTGNAVYRIEPQGFVSEVFRDDVMVFGLARKDDQLYIATGPGGTLYQLDIGTEEHVAIAKTRSQQLTSVLATADGRLLIGSGGADGSTVSQLSAKLAALGTFTSPVLDATQISAFGKLQVRGTMPADSSMTVATRSGNVSDEDSPLWSDWSSPVPAARFTQVNTPGARYVQYRITFAGNGTATPSLDEVKLAYQQPNVAPRIDSVTVAPAAPDATSNAADGEPAANSVRQIEWATTEPNGDELRFNIYQRSGAGSPWVVLAKDLTEATYAWDTRRVSDGTYEIKVEASDALANAVGTAKTASRVADSVVVDNTPPVIGDIKVERSNGKVSVSLRAADHESVIDRLEYAVDDDQHWQTVQPSDMLSDSPDEQYTIVLPDTGGQAARVVSLRCRDEVGNTAHESVTIRPEK